MNREAQADPDQKERKAGRPPPVPTAQCVSVNLNFEPPLRCTKTDGHQPPRHAARADLGTMHQGVDVGDKVWYWAEYQGLVGYRKGEMLDPKTIRQQTPATEDEGELP